MARASYRPHTLACGSSRPASRSASSSRSRCSGSVRGSRRSGSTEATIRNHGSSACGSVSRATSLARARTVLLPALRVQYSSAGPTATGMTSCAARYYTAPDRPRRGGPAASRVPRRSRTARTRGTGRSRSPGNSPGTGIRAPGAGALCAARAIPGRCGGQARPGCGRPGRAAAPARRTPAPRRGRCARAPPGCRGAARCGAAPGRRRPPDRRARPARGRSRPAAGHWIRSSARSNPSHASLTFCIASSPSPPGRAAPAPSLRAAVRHHGRVPARSAR